MSRRDGPVLAVADEVPDALWGTRAAALGPDLVPAAGDLPWDYLEFLASVTDRPVVFVPGNHDPEVVDALGLVDEVALGVRMIPVEQIVGSVDRVRVTMIEDGDLLGDDETEADACLRVAGARHAVFHHHDWNAEIIAELGRRRD